MYKCDPNFCVGWNMRPYVHVVQEFQTSADYTTAFTFSLLRLHHQYWWECYWPKVYVIPSVRGGRGSERTVSEISLTYWILGESFLGDIYSGIQIRKWVRSFLWNTNIFLDRWWLHHSRKCNVMRSWPWGFESLLKIVVPLMWTPRVVYISFSRTGKFGKEPVVN